MCECVLLTGAVSLHLDHTLGVAAQLPGVERPDSHRHLHGCTRHLLAPPTSPGDSQSESTFRQAVTIRFLLLSSFFFLQPPSFLGFTTFSFPLPSSSLLLFFQPELFLLPHTFLPIFSVFVLLHLFLLCNFICRCVFLSSSSPPSGFCSFILVLSSSFLPLLHLSRFFSQIIFPSPPFLTSFPVFLSLLSSLLFPELLLLLHVSIFSLFTFLLSVMSPWKRPRSAFGSFVSVSVSLVYLSSRGSLNTRSRRLSGGKPSLLTQ